MASSPPVLHFLQTSCEALKIDGSREPIMGPYERSTILKKAILSLLLTLVALPALAQPRPMPPPGGHRPPGDAALVNYLQLTADQKTAWDTAHKDFGDAVQPLFDKQRAAHQQLEAALQSK